MVHPAITEIAVLTTTVGAMEDALKLAKEIVDRRLAACVQLDAIAASVYRWEGALCQEPEIRLTMKTLGFALPELEDFIAGHHPHALPQVTWTTMQCDPRYGKWVHMEITGTV